MSAVPHRARGERRRRNRAHDRLARSAFCAHRLFANAHVQTAAGLVLRSARLPMRIERLETPDDDFIELGWINEGARGPLAVLVHGLGGGLDSGYLHALAAQLAQRDWTSVILQLRGAGREPNRQPSMYHHGGTDELRWLCRMLRDVHPHRRLCAVGWSLGASIVIKSLGEDGAGSPLDAAAVVSAPLQLDACVEHLRVGAARVYQELMLWSLKSALRRKYLHAALPTDFDLQQTLAARDFYEFGDAFTARLCGMDSRRYCEAMNPGRFLAGVARPLLVVQARDDPFLGAGALPALPVAAAVRIELAEHGGHVGFVASGEWGLPESWLEQRLAMFLAAPA